MIIFPAIDIKDGNVVRLFQGDYDQMTVYSEDPVQVAKTFKSCGATHLHLVDLDGAKEGRLINFENIKRIIQEAGLFVQVGGGIRDMERIKAYLDLGVHRVILGTAAVTEPEFLKAAIEKYGDKIAVGVDVKAGRVAINGWQKVTDIETGDFLGSLEKLGVATVIYTDISKDGGLEGTNLEAYEDLEKNYSFQIIASGGVTYMEELRVLKNMGVYGAILGKALYAGSLVLREVVKHFEQ
ncbi:MAG: 1-(5-phosphoribosyl)-5-[(5-phosphoribosylamino)methylideneamino]imidazole-4-carboxamide isomerase [Anaerovoracaceae bacterium]|jgi:phosphoribosylformimino-5-aminoimidazole carboxamide ribotide isomerase|nr:1-(5-phosphoribosyl)-5-[(5-phosphoribosylamino)methylideneamino]imidazole-4-carboxamide isomerase [Anaerovoracaceae bacterium]